MNVFVSYSFKDSELYLLSLLLKALRMQGHHVETSEIYLESNAYLISSSDLFIGIVTSDSESIDEVLNEWEIAELHNVKTLLLVEDGVFIEDSNVNFVRFDRYNPEDGIERLFQKVKKSKKQDTDLGDVLVVGGIIVGIAALISLLAGDSKK